VAMVRLHRELGEKGFRSKILLQVHDELVLECPEDEVDEVRSLVVTIMEGAISLEVPLVVNVGTGKNWAEL
jgi:DNA polymerase-1